MSNVDLGDVTVLSADAAGYVQILLLDPPPTKKFSKSVFNSQPLFVISLHCITSRCPSLLKRNTFGRNHVLSIAMPCSKLRSYCPPRVLLFVCLVYFLAADAKHLPCLSLDTLIRYSAQIRTS